MGHKNKLDKKDLDFLRGFRMGPLVEGVSALTQLDGLDLPPG